MPDDAPVMRAMRVFTWITGSRGEVGECRSMAPLSVGNTEQGQDALAQVALERRGSETYMPELDAALTAGEAAFSMPIRQKVIRAAIFLS